ncbi:MAG: glycosyltransferase family 4 protein [Sphingobacteriales bacterium]|nr:glycosyltransferase family 4 protein [Sphingobacteriales bacterium]
MRIAVNTRFLLNDYLEGYGNFLYEMFRRITENHPEHEFIFLFDRPFDPRFVFGKNVVPVVAGPAARHPLLWKYWYDFKVPALLKKYRADIFVSCDGFCSLRTSVPQCLVLHDLAFLHFPAGIPRSQLAFYKKYTPRFISKAKTLVTVSEFSKKDILAHYPEATGKINVVYNGIKPLFRPYSWEEREAVKKKYTGGKDYFVYTGAIHPRKNLVGLLKAFSLFKKRQQSAMKLVITGRLAWKNESFTESLTTYKYRNDVILTGYLPDEELAGITASAYALVYPSFFEGFGVPVAEAMQASVPVITTAGSAMEEIAGEAALYAAPADHAALADQLMRLYKDERLRGELVAKGTERARAFNWDESARIFWALLEETVA